MKISAKNTAENVQNLRKKFALNLQHRVCCRSEFRKESELGGPCFFTEITFNHAARPRKGI